MVETKHKIGMCFRGELTKAANPDAENYVYPDSGCSNATKFLGEQSLCFDCPFPDCKKVGRGGQE